MRVSADWFQKQSTEARKLEGEIVSLRASGRSSSSALDRVWEQTNTRKKHYTGSFQPLTSAKLRWQRPLSTLLNALDFRVLDRVRATAVERGPIYGFGRGRATEADWRVGFLLQ